MSQGHPKLRLDLSKANRTAAESFHAPQCVTSAGGTLPPTPRRTPRRPGLTKQLQAFQPWCSGRSWHRISQTWTFPSAGLSIYCLLWQLNLPENNSKLFQQQPASEIFQMYFFSSRFPLSHMMSFASQSLSAKNSAFISLKFAKL